MDDTYSEWSSMTKKQTNLIGLGILIIIILASLTARGDLYVYNLEANLTESNVTYVEQEPFYYDVFHIQTDSFATLTFNNYNATLSSTNSNYNFNDPYLYLYTIEEPVFNGFDGANVQLTLLDEDDDGNENSPEGLYFYLDNIEIDNQLVAVVSSYEPYSTGQVDFTVISDQQLYIIPEPLALSFVAVGGLSLFMLKRKLR